jgi:hypothetical protein
MGIHVTRTRRGVVVKYFRHAGERIKMQALRSGRGGGSSGKAASSGGSSGSGGTRGDFGADFE